METDSPSPSYPVPPGTSCHTSTDVASDSTRVGVSRPAREGFPCPSGDPDAPYRGVRLTPEQIAEVLALHRAWRLGEGGRRADLTGAYLTRANLTRANLTRANLAGADLTGADLTRANLTRANLTGADLTGADLTGADLARANLTGADLTGADLTGADLTGADLARANLTGADLTGADLTGAYLTRAYLGRTLQRIGPIDGYTMVAVSWADGPRIACGCRWFTVAEARAWWGKGCAAESPERKAHGEIMLAGLDALLSICRAHGWTGCER